MSRERKEEIVFTVYLRKEGRITVPKGLRDAHGFKDGDLVECRVKKVR